MDPRAQELVDRAHGDPFSKAYWYKVRAMGRHGASTPGDVLGQRTAIGTMAIQDMEPEQHLSLALDLLGAPAYLWTDFIDSQCWAMKLPDHVVSPRLLPVPKMWWSFESPNNYEGEQGELEQEGTGFFGIFLRDTQVGVEVWAYDSPDLDDLGHIQTRHDATLAYKSRWPDDYDDDDDMTMHVLQLLAFLNSPYIPVTSHAAGRGERRAYGRYWGKDEPVPSVSFVDLRRPVSRPGNGTSGEGAPLRHQHLVSGHYKAQWYSTEQAHHVIYISPYMRGPEGGPFQEHVYKVKR